jgi:hypothetical protein
MHSGQIRQTKRNWEPRRLPRSAHAPSQCSWKFLPPFIRARSRAGGRLPTASQWREISSNARVVWSADSSSCVSNRSTTSIRDSTASTLPVRARTCLARACTSSWASTFCVSASSRSERLCRSSSATRFAAERIAQPGSDYRHPITQPSRGPRGTSPVRTCRLP